MVKVAVSEEVGQETKALTYRGPWAIRDWEQGWQVLLLLIRKSSLTIPVQVGTLWRECLESGCQAGYWEAPEGFGGLVGLNARGYYYPHRARIKPADRQCPGHQSRGPGGTG